MTHSTLENVFDVKKNNSYVLNCKQWLYRTISLIYMVVSCTPQVEKYRAIKMVYAQKRYENILRQRMYQDRYGCILGPAHTWGGMKKSKF